MNRLLTPIPYETVLGDLRDSGGLNLSDQVARQVILPIGNASPDGDDASVTSRLIKSDSSGLLLADRHSVGYCDRVDTAVNYTDTSGMMTVTWPEGYKEVWAFWGENTGGMFFFVRAIDETVLYDIDFQDPVKLVGFASDFIVEIVGSIGRTGIIYLWFFK